MITPQQFSASFGRVVQAGISLLVLAVFGALADQLPGVTTSIGAGFRVLEAIQIAVAAVMVGLVVGATRPLTVVTAFYANHYFRVNRDPERARLAVEIRHLSDGVAYVIAIAIAWFIVNPQVSVLLRLQWLRNLDWLRTVVTLAFLAGLLFVLFRMYQALQPLLSVLSGTVTDPFVRGMQVQCPRCQHLNSRDVRFCSNCGNDLQTVTATPVASAQQIVCASCGAVNPAGTHFCGQCGRSLEPVTEQLPVSAPVPPVGSNGPMGTVVVPQLSCGECGTALSPDDVFCPNCGKAVRSHA
jgi:RNA polymerase subunit RPABC4/transcription elongation factor Spt4